MVQEAEDEGFKIDHFFPTAKGGPWTAYTNLFLACDRCNQHKSDNWPDLNARMAGVRYLNCCEEFDYGEHIFEGENGVVFSDTVPGRYHIVMLKLNRPDLVRLRLARTKVVQEIEQAVVFYGGMFDDFMAKTGALKQMLYELIPPIPRSRPNG
jgi:hypothetical protein